jgi:transcriptional regulator with XRE-family HTH domain
MSSASRGAIRKQFWQAAGTLLGQLRAHHGWTEGELAERAGLSVDLVASYERDPERYPGLEAWWRLTTALGVGLEVFLQQVEKRVSVRLLHDVRPPAAATGGLPRQPREQVAPPAAPGTTDELSRYLARLGDKPEGEG